MNSLMVPIVLWGNKPPTHKIRCMECTKDGKHIITGCVDGQICIWDTTDGIPGIIPRALLFGHTSSVISIAAVDNGLKDAKFFVSASVSNELFLWDLDDMCCVENTRLSGSPTKLIPLTLSVNGESTPCVACIGFFAEIFIISCTSLDVVATLISRIYPDWISSCSLGNVGNNVSAIGLTLSGTIKVWQIPSNLTSVLTILEDESKQLRCPSAVQISFNQEHSNLLLAVCQNEWQIYDARDFSLLCKVQAPTKVVLSGGDILHNHGNIIIWDQQGHVYIYKLQFASVDVTIDSVNSGREQKAVLLFSFSTSNSQNLSLPPVFLLNTVCRDQPLLYAGYSKGFVEIWKIAASKTEYFENCSDLIKFKSATGLTNHWDSLIRHPSGIIDHFGKDSSLQVTTSLYLEKVGQLACGRDDGSIVIVPAARACRSQLIRDGPMTKKTWVPHRTLRGHLDRVTCLLYPHQESDRYSQQWFVSGSADFSVILWELFTGSQLHVFNVHGGEITQLIVPPEQCSARIQQSICSVANDHSVSMLNLRERKCVMLAASHTAMVTSIKWRPMDDFILVSCADGGLFIWQMETGHLDRYLSGVSATVVLESCDECSANGATVAQGNVNISQAIKRRNLAGFKAAAQQGLRNIIETIEDKMQENDRDTAGLASVTCPKAMVIQPIRASLTHDNDSHIIFFNTEAIIGTLLREQAMRKKKLKSQRFQENGMNSSNSTRKAINSFISQVKHQLLDSSDQGSSGTSSASIEHRRREKRDKKTAQLEIDSIVDIAQLLLSCLHGWGLDLKLDDVCKNKLGIFCPVYPISFGALSRDGQLALLLPSWTKPNHTQLTHTTHSNNGCSHTVFHMEHIIPSNSNIEKCSHRIHWEICSSITTNHLLSVISVSNTLMELSNVNFTKQQGPKYLEKNAHEEYYSGNVSGSINNDSVDNAQIKQGWALVATLHCVLLQELLHSNNYKPPKLELLARRWQDRCLEVREAAQALLLAKLRQIEPTGRRKIVEEWAKHMPDYIQQQHIDLVPNSRLGEQNGSDNSSDDTVDKASISSVELATEAPPHSTRLSKQRFSYETRRRQATAVIILGVIGAEFGQEMEPSRSNTSSPSKQSDIPEGFQLKNYSLARNTCKALVYLLLHPASSRLPAHAPIRRAAIDLLGRGFTVWEPYIEVSAVLLGLLELCADYDLHKASIYSGLPLSAKADSCRSSHHALCLIATARPQTFIITIAREVARHNAAAANPQHQALLATSIIVRSKAEVLRIIELLAEKMLTDVSDLLVEVMDIIIFCIDTNGLRTSNSLIETVPALSRFHSISYDPRSRRIAVGTRQGLIIFFDLRTNKHQQIFKGRHPITTLAFSPEGKYLSAYSVQDNYLSFWMTSSTLFGMLQSQVKCVKTLRLLPAAVSQRLANTPDLNRDSMRNFMKLAWVSNRTTVLLMPDGNEYRAHV